MADYLPIDFENRMKEMLGAEFDAFLASYEGERYRGLRANPLKKNLEGLSAAKLFEMLCGKDSSLSEDIVRDCPVASIEKIDWADNGYYYSEEDQPGKHPWHEAGMYYIQEPSAMLPAQLLEAKPGEKVLDLCAAPGGKTTQIATFMKGRGLLVSNEINPQRARILSENVERMGIRNAVVTNESPEKLAERFECFFDKIAVDAPCSGEGMFRKNDEALSEWSLANVEMCAARQAGILDCAASMLKGGGRIVYSTCTFSREENEDTVEAFLDRHPDFTCTKQHRIWPHKAKGEGHFAAVLEKGNAGMENIDSSVSKADSKKLHAFFDDIVNPLCFEDDGVFGHGRIESFGENLYLVPSMMPQMRGLKVLRPGLCLGCEKKDRFEPAHSLALALSPTEVKRYADLSAKAAADYIKGLTQNVDGEKGWTLVCVDGFSLAWGKLAGGVLKNHYPKGLRKG